MEKLTDGIHAVANVQSATKHAGFKTDPNKPDLALLYFAEGATVAGVFTKNKVKAWPVQYGQQLLKVQSQFKAILINSGNANASNGPGGKKVMMDVIQDLASQLDIQTEEILVSSTGVIGAPLDYAPFEKTLPLLVNDLQSENSKAVAQAIMTTDTLTKETAYSTEIDGKTVHIGAVAKGSGMIHPNLGTMLAYIVTDIACDQALLNQLLKQAVDQSFNSISVDGETSTNDTVLLATTDQVNIDLSKENIANIQTLLNKTCLDLAQMIVKDGEGASKFITVHVKGAESEQDAIAVAKSIATSSLVKTAIYGEDPNWGRVLSAAGNSQVDVLEPGQIDIFFKSDKGVIQTCKNGAYHFFDPATANDILTASELTIEVNLNLAKSQATVWTSDLTHDYVEINADYHT